MHNLTSYIIATGYIGIFVTLFAESGFLLGFFLPGDSLLFTLGILASAGHFNIVYLILLGMTGAIAGDSFGYAFGKKFGPRLFNRDDSLFFKRRYVEKTQQFYEKYGRKTLIMARFVPIVRTFAPIMAGVGSMPYKNFLVYNVIGGVAWAAGLLSISYFLGSTFPIVQTYLSYVIIGVIIVSLIPIVIELVRNQRS